MIKLQNENKKLILIVDDDIYTIELLKKILEKEGYLIKTCTNSNEVFSCIKSEYPDLLLLDVGLKDISGLELCSILKSDPLNMYLPVIFITGNTDKETLIQAYKAGGIDYIVKPFEKEVLLARIETQIKISQLHKELLQKNEEIAAINEEYSAINEEYIAINEELSDTNQKLQKLYQETEKREDFLRTTFNSISEGIISTDINGIINNINKFASELLNVQPNFTIGKPFYVIFKIAAPNRKLSSTDFFELVINNKEPIFFDEDTILSVADKKIFISGNISPILAKSGDINGYVITFSDVTEKILKSKQLDESRERFSLVVEALQNGIWDWNLVNDKVYYSPEWKAQIGYEDYEIENKFKVWVEHLHPEERNQKIKELEDFLISPQNFFHLQFRFRHKNGSYRHIQNKAIVVKDNKGKVVRMVGSHSDITNQIESETKIRESQKRWEAIFNGLSHPTMVLDTNHNIIEVNKALCEKSGLKPEEIKKLKCWQIFHSPESKNHHEFCPLQKTLYSKNTESAEMEMNAFNGTYLVSCTPLLDDKNNITAVIHIATDITELKKTLIELKDSEAKFRTAFDTVSDSIIISKLSDLKIVYANKDFLNKVGLEYKDVKGKSTLELKIWAKPEQRHDIVENIRKFGVINDYEADFFDKDEKIRIGLVNAASFDLSNEKHGIFIVRDITERKFQEKLLKIALEKAEESDRLKSAFLANMSHEIRTPMNGILGFAELLKTPNLSEKDRSLYISIIEKSGHRMLNLINDLIDISKVEAGIIKPHPKECDLNQIFRDLFFFFKPEADAKNIKLDYFTGLKDENSKVISDPKLLNSILINLIKNAIKYTDIGEIIFEYKLKNDFIEFHVKDTGIGIPNEKISSIFNRFVQADPENIAAKQGAGLGLAIAKAYVELLGGKINVVSEKNKGSDFYFTIPYKPIIGCRKIIPDSIANESYALNGNLNILIAEDDKISELYLKNAVKSIAGKIYTANNGNDAVKIIRHNPQIDLVLMDIRMPELNGYEATQKIRQFNKNIKIIAQTAFGHENDRKKSLEAGCNDYITKPVNKTELLEIINKLFKQ